MSLEHLSKSEERSSLNGLKIMRLRLNIWTVRLFLKLIQGWKFLIRIYFFLSQSWKLLNWISRACLTSQRCELKWFFVLFKCLMQMFAKYCSQLIRFGICFSFALRKVGWRTHHDFPAYIFIHLSTQAVIPSKQS